MRYANIVVAIANILSIILYTIYTFIKLYIERYLIYLVVDSRLFYKSKHFTRNTILFREY